MEDRSTKALFAIAALIAAVAIAVAAAVYVMRGDAGPSQKERDVAEAYCAMNIEGDIYSDEFRNCVEFELSG